MFGTKSKEIARLIQDIVEWQEIRDKMAAEIDRLRDHIGTLETEAERRAQINADLSHQIKVEIENSKRWSADFQQLNDRYTLLDSLLKQLRVDVTLPVKKNAGRG